MGQMTGFNVKPRKMICETRSSNDQDDADARDDRFCKLDGMGKAIPQRGGQRHHPGGSPLTPMTWTGD